MLAAEWFANLLVCYLALGILFALAFVTAGIGRVDPVAKDSGLAFRLIIFPGVAATWPWLLKKWLLKRETS
jgi:hypothetical protein